MRAVVADAVLQYEANRKAQVPETDEDWARFSEQVKSEPMTEAKLEAEDKHLTNFISKQARKLRIKQSDIVRIIHENRASRRIAASRTRH